MNENDNKNKLLSKEEIENQINEFLKNQYLIFEFFLFLYHLHYCSHYYQF